jgi:hypothetical protein
VREVLVRLLLPAGRPDELVALRQPPEAPAAVLGNAMHHPVDPVKASRRRSRGRKSEEADDTVDVEEQKWRFAAVSVHLFYALLTRE